MWFGVSGNTTVEKARIAEQKSLSGQSEGWNILNGKFLAPSARAYILFVPENCEKEFKQYPHKQKFSRTVSGNMAAFAGQGGGSVRVYDFSDGKILLN